MIAEQYYWFKRRPQLLRAFNAQRAMLVGASSKAIHFQKIDEANPYLFNYSSDGSYDENEIAQKFDHYRWKLPAGKCSSARHGNFHGRNYDWYFQQDPTLIVRTPKTSKHLHSTIGTATLMHLKAKDIADGWKDGYEFIECALVDGINDAGLVCNLNVCPPGDNPNYPTKQSEQEAIARGESLLKIYNVTYDTNPGKPKRFVGQICRTILDNFSTCQEVKEHINDYSWFAARNTDAEDSFQEEFHCMVSDKDSTLVIEFVENKVVVHEWKADGTYVGCSDPALMIGSQVQPIMTNFYLSKWDGNSENLGIVQDQSPAERNATVTEHGMGYERWQKIDSMLKTASMEDVMKAVSYRQMYRAPYYEWTSEFLDRANDLSYRDDMLNSDSYKKFRNDALVLCEKEDIDDKNGIRPEKGKTWQTVHTVVYDIDKKTMVLCSQEKLDQTGDAYSYTTLNVLSRVQSGWSWQFGVNCPEDFKQLILENNPQPTFDPNPSNPPYGTWGGIHVWHQFKYNGYENYVEYGKPDATELIFKYCMYINGEIYEDEEHCFFVKLTRGSRK